MTDPNPQVDARAVHAFALWWEDAQHAVMMRSPAESFNAGWRAALAASDAETSARALRDEIATAWAWMNRFAHDSADAPPQVLAWLDRNRDTADRALLTEEKQG